MLRVIHCLPSPCFHHVMWWRRLILRLLSSERYRLMMASSFLLFCIFVLSVPYVPEKFLGIRSPARVLQMLEEVENSSAINAVILKDEEYINNDINVNNINNNNNKDSNYNKNKPPESQAKRAVPHKFWAKARPHNKFRRKHKSQKSEKPNPEKRLGEQYSKDVKSLLKHINDVPR